MSTQRDDKTQVFIHTCPETGRGARISHELVEDLRKQGETARCGYCREVIAAGRQQTGAPK